MQPLNIIKIIGIPDDNQAKVLYNDGFFRDFSLFFDGNSFFFETLQIPNSQITTLYIGGEKQFEQLKLVAKPDVIISLICDPEIQKKSLSLLNGIGFKALLLNHPLKIYNTARDILAQKLPSDERFVIPKTYRVKPKNQEELKTLAKDFFENQSFLLRPVISHGGEGLIKVDKLFQTQFDEYHFNGENEYFLTQFFDFKSDDGKYKKARFFVLNGQIYPRHYIISNNWKIHSQSRKELFNESMYQKEEEEFLQNLPKIFFDFCHYIYEFLQLDFFGIDCAILPDGRVLLFEANVCMRPFGNHKEAYLQNINQNLQNRFIDLISQKSYQ